MAVSFSSIIQKAAPKYQHGIAPAMREALAMMPPTTVSSLSNGFRVATEENPNAKFATVGVWMNTGSKFETRGQNQGAAKMLELCGLQATTSKNRTQLCQALDEIGGQLESKTGREHSYIYVKCPKASVTKAVELLGEMVTNARLADEDIAAARKEMDEERRAQEEDTEALMETNLHVCAFDSTERGLGNLVIPPATKVNINRGTLEAFRLANFTGPRMVLVGAGAVNHTELEKAAKQAFGKLDASPAPQLPHRFIGGDIKLWNTRHSLSFLTFAVETCGAACEDTVPLNIAMHIHGSWERHMGELASSNLYRAMKVYSAHDWGGPPFTPFPPEAIEKGNCFHYQYENSGLIGMNLITRCRQIYACHNAGTHWDTLQWSMNRWTELSFRSMHADQLEHAKTSYKAQLVFDNDGSILTAHDIGRQVLHRGRRVPLTEMFNRIDDCTRTNVMETLNHYYYSRAPVYSFSGYLGSLPNYDLMRSWTGKVLTMM